MAARRHGATLAGTLLWLFGLGVVAAGLGATLYWFLTLEEPAALLRPAVLVALSTTVAVTLVNLALRWVRWHFLTRRAGVSLATRDSLIVFLGTLPAILTPFYLGELLRAVVIGKRHPPHRVDIVWIWVIERVTDLLLVAVLLLLARSEWWPALGAAGVFALAWAGVRSFYTARRDSAFPRPTSMLLVLVLSCASVLLPPLALWKGLALVGTAPGLDVAVGVYASTALLGNLSGLPIGISVTGSSMVVQLADGGVPLADAVVATWVFRVATVWFVVAFGSLVALGFRRTLSDMMRAPEDTGHFDSIAHEYEVEIPDHVRDRLVARKTRAMLDRLGPAAGRLRGLDIGCGPGWYACEMARQGFDMKGIEMSEGQLATARRNAAEAGLGIELHATSADRLPFPDAHFDFAYAINVMHHITDEDTRRGAFDEIVRVLKPGGVFFLQEINTDNPVFRFYMGYVFPLIRAIDEGTERWIPPSALPEVSGAAWQPNHDHFTFIPDFVPEPLHRRLEPLEHDLERSRLRSWSAHYVARLVKQ